MDAIAAAKPAIRPVRRVITRAPGLDGEDYDSVAPARFEELVLNGAFCLNWQAHGLRYGIPVDVLTDVRNGRTRIANLSRGVLTESARIFPRLHVLNLTASPSVLAKRLSSRGRENADEIADRLEQAEKPLPSGIKADIIQNNGPMSETLAAALAALQPARV